jgi:hypothetical protein
MAFINGEFKHPDYDISIQVLEPEKREGNYSKGRVVRVEFDSMQDFTTGELAKILDWIKAVNVYIKKSFDRKGKKKEGVEEFKYEQ